MNSMTKNFPGFDQNRDIDRLPECPKLSAGAIKRVTKVVFIRSNPKPADVIFIFGSWFGDDWNQVVALYSRGFAPIVYIGGGGVHDKLPGSISHLIRDIFIEKGVPRRAIITDECSKNTLEDALSAKKLFLNSDKSIRHQRILFASKSVHSGRCYRTLRKVFPKSTLFPFSYDFMWDKMLVQADQIRKNWWLYKLISRAVWGEYQRIRQYSRRDDISK